MSVGRERRRELVAHRVVGPLDAAPALRVERVQVLRRHQHEQHRPRPERVRDHVAPARAGGQVVLVEKDLRVAEQRVEFARQGRGFVGAVARAVADEDTRCHGVGR